MTREAELAALEERIVASRNCPRLMEYIETISKVKVRRYRGQEYWGKPVPGFGDPYARLLIIGLAPAAHGGNRTGRMFTGDSSGDWLMRALYETGFANQPKSISRDDGLRLQGAFITALVRCAPPDNKPTREEILESLGFLSEELRLLEDVVVVVTLGRLAFEYYGRLVGAPRPMTFKHGAAYKQKQGGPTLVASYHPSRQNTQTGRLRWPEWLGIFQTARRLVEGEADDAQGRRADDHADEQRSELMRKGGDKVAERHELDVLRKAGQHDQASE
ncbi:MAG: uracil-DNA glycosylase [Conexivisphaerales archaeon]